MVEARFSYKNYNDIVPIKTSEFTGSSYVLRQISFVVNNVLDAFYCKLKQIVNATDYR